MPSLIHRHTFLDKLRRKSSLLLLTILVSLPGALHSQTPNPQLAWTRVRIPQLLDLIRTAQQEHASQEQQGALWAQLGLAYWNATNFPEAEDAYHKSLSLLKSEPSARPRYAATLEELASLYLSYGRLSDAESTDQQALAVRKQVGDPAGVGITEIHLADIALVEHQYKQAEQLTRRGMLTLQSVSDPLRVARLSGFITLTYALCSRKHCSEGLQEAQQAITFADQHFEPESAPIGFAKETLAFAEWKSGDKQNAERDMLEGLRILRKTLAPADPRLAGAMLQYHAYLVEANRPAEAKDIQREVSSITRQAGVYCADCAVSVNTLSNSLR